MSDSNDITVLNPGLYKNLLTQIESIYRHSNELSLKTRAIDLSAKQRGIITDYLNYARCSGKYPRDYLI